MKEGKPVIATADAKLIGKVITYYLKYASPSDKKEQERLMNLFHRLRRLEE